MERLELEDLTKSELIALIKARCSPFSITQYDLLSVRWETLTSKQEALHNEAIASLDSDSPDGYEKYLEIEEKISRLETRSMAILDEMRKVRGAR